MDISSKRKGSLQIAPAVFKALHDALIADFSARYSLDVALLSDFQLYGFDHYDERKPSLAGYIHSVTNIRVNGKYLYNKMRDVHNGKPHVRLTREYIHVYFLTLGYKDVVDFLNAVRLDPSLREQQLQWCDVLVSPLPEDDHYVGYYVGEDGEIIKTLLTFYDQHRRAKWVLVYWEGNETPSTYCYNGIVKSAGSTVSLYFDATHSSTERTALISLFFGNPNIVNRPFLFGSYSGFDRDDCPVAGEIVFQRVASEKEQKELAYSRNVDYAIQNLIASRRIVTGATDPQRLFDIAEDNLYTEQMASYGGEYTGYMIDLCTHDCEVFKVALQTGSARAKLTFGDGSIYRGHFKMINQGMILLGWFGSSFPFQALNLVMNSTFYQQTYLLGVYSRILRQDRPSVGRACLMRESTPIKALQKRKNMLLQALHQRAHVEEMPMHYLFAPQGQADFLSFQPSSCERLATSRAAAGERPLNGVYEVYGWNENGARIQKEVLLIAHDESVSYKSHAHIGKGKVQQLDGGALSVRIDRWEQEKLYVQLLLFVGRYKDDEIHTLSGVRSAISKSFAPMAHKVVLLRSKRSFDRQESKFYDPYGKAMTSLSHTSTSIEALLADPSFRPIKALQEVN